MDAVKVAWLAEVVLLFWRDKRNANRLPWPSELLATFVLYGTLSVLPGNAGKVGAALGWGVVVATFLGIWTPTPGNLTKVSAPSNPLAPVHINPNVINQATGG